MTNVAVEAPAPVWIALEGDEPNETIVQLCIGSQVRAEVRTYYAVVSSATYHGLGGSGQALNVYPLPIVGAQGAANRLRVRAAYRAIGFTVIDAEVAPDALPLLPTLKQVQQVIEELDEIINY